MKVSRIQFQKALKIYPHSSEINDFNEVSMKKPGQIQKFWR
jgi:hypothetical protein